jgi:transposase InsO family protein
MWDKLSQWWNLRRTPGQPPPEQTVAAPPPESQYQAEPPPVEKPAELANGLAAVRAADTSQSTDTEPPDQGPDCIEPSSDPTQSNSATIPDARHCPSPELQADLDAPDYLDEDDGARVEPESDDDAWTPGLGESLATDRDHLESLLAVPLGGRFKRPRGRRLTRPELEKVVALTPEQRLAVLDCWRRSGLPAKDFAPLVGVSRHTLYAWKQRFERLGAAGFIGESRGAKKGSRLPDATRRAILALKQSNPDWGCERISNMLLRSSALPASPTAVARVLHEAGYELRESPTRPHPDHPRRFERARPNQLWQTDLFTFVLKRQNRRVYLVAFLDDHSRFLVSFGLHASQSTALVLEVLRAGITAYGAPDEVLTDNGAQYVAWRGESAFHKELKRRGIVQVVARPRHPQTLGKIERFWGTLWRECIETAVFLDLADARARIGHFIDWYNFQRVHSGIDGLVPADRFFHAAPEVARSLKDRVAANAIELARHGVPKPPFYLTGQVGGRNFSLHAEGPRVFLTPEGGPRQEVDLVPPAGTNHATAATPEERSAMPRPVCPDGSPQSIPVADPHAAGATNPTALPDTSAVDELRRLQQDSDRPTPDQTAGQS